MRGVLGQTIIQFPVPDAKTPADGIARATAFIRQWKSDDLIVPAIAPHSMYTLDAATLKQIRAVADREAAPVIIHLAETADEHQGRAGRSTRRRRRSSSSRSASGVSGRWPRTRVHVTPADIADPRPKRRIGVSHNPESNMKLASGTAPVIEMQRAGVTVGLGTDGAASNNDLDMFEAMRQAAFLHKLATGDPRALPAEDGDPDGDDRRRQRRSAWTDDSGRSSPASAPTSSSSRCGRRGRRRCTIRSRTSSTSPTATTCGRDRERPDPDARPARARR